PHQKASLQKTSHKFQLSLVGFQRAQQLSAKRQRTVMQGVKMAVDDNGEGVETHDPPSSPSQRQAQLLQAQLSPHELAYQESVIQEREEDIREIEAGVHELAEIFRDLGTLVHQQGGILGEPLLSNLIAPIGIDNIDYKFTIYHVFTRVRSRGVCIRICNILFSQISLLIIAS
ncbi:t-SNARE, partial [Lentinula aff. detonsa]